MLSVVLNPDKNLSCEISYFCHQAKVVGFFFFVLLLFSGQKVLRQLQDPSSCVTFILM